MMRVIAVSAAGFISSTLVDRPLAEVHQIVEFRC